MLLALSDQWQVSTKQQNVMTKDSTWGSTMISLADLLSRVLKVFSMLHPASDSNASLKAAHKAENLFVNSFEGKDFNRNSFHSPLGCPFLFPIRDSILWLPDRTSACLSLCCGFQALLPLQDVPLWDALWVCGLVASPWSVSRTLFPFCGIGTQ